MKKSIYFFVMGLCAFVVLTACHGRISAREPNPPQIVEKEEANSGATVAFDYTDPAKLKEKYDIVIVGAGGAGMAAAIQAYENGASPVILEKMPIAGGNTMKASAGMNAAETKFQSEQGVEDSVDKFFEETLAGGGNANNQELLRYMVDHSAEAIDWLDSIGITLSNLTTTGGMSVTRTHRPADGSAVGSYLVEGLKRNIAQREIPLFVDADVIKINEKDGTVTGVEVVIAGETKIVNADAVIVATGGFGSNKELIGKLQPAIKDYVSTNHEGSTGDGIAMIEAVGGVEVDMEKIQIHPTVQQETAYLITEAVRGEGAILINSEGNRFFNEMETRDKVSATIIGLPEQSAFLIFDSGVRDRAKAIEQYLSMGFVLEAETLEELAEKMNVDKENLAKSLDNWNKAVSEQSDLEFGRTTAMSNELSQAPFYAIKIAPGIHHTMGGVKINTKTEVLDVKGDAIPALYAAGEVTGGLHGDNRIGGNAVADIIIFGRQAGAQASEFVKEQ